MTKDEESNLAMTEHQNESSESQSKYEQIDHEEDQQYFNPDDQQTLFHLNIPPIGSV